MYQQNTKEKIYSRYKKEIAEFFTILEETRAKYDKKEFFVTRNGMFGNDDKRDNHFHCPAITESVIITPEHKVYPCNGLVYDEYCIGYWDETGVYITKEIEHDPKKCMVLERQLKH